MIGAGWFSARRCYLRRHRDGIRAAFEVADNLDALRLLFQTCPVGPPALRSVARLEQELDGLLSQHGGRVAVRIRRERGMAIPGPSTTVVRLPAHLAAPGELPARWWGVRAWFGLPEGADANKGDLRAWGADGPVDTSGGAFAAERPSLPADHGKTGRLPSVAELSLLEGTARLAGEAGTGRRRQR